MSKNTVTIPVSRKRKFNDFSVSTITETKFPTEVVEEEKRTKVTHHHNYFCNTHNNNQNVCLMYDCSGTIKPIKEKTVTCNYIS